MNPFKLKNILIITALWCAPGTASAQTEQDAIMMNKNQFCNGFMYNYSSWDHYWEGTRKRNNLNLGTVSTQSLMYMANYGITNNLNIMAGAPYIWTKATDGTLRGMSGVQDLSVNLKWRFLNHKFGKSKLALYGIGGFSTPITDYTPDFLPLSIGMGATTLTARGMADLQVGKFTATAHAAYIRRNNITIDRDAYYTDRLHLTNEVMMPDMTNYQVRMGYRGKYLITEAIFNRMVTDGGFDITRNNMPFPSNQMNATTWGVYAKYTLPFLTNIDLLANASFTSHGRNVGQATTFGGGIFYAFYLKKSSKPTASL